MGSSRHSTASGRMSNVHSYRCAWGVTHSVSSTAPANASGRDARIRRQNPTYAAAPASDAPAASSVGTRPCSGTSMAKSSLSVSSPPGRRLAHSGSPPRTPVIHAT